MRNFARCVCVCACACVWERERERVTVQLRLCVCVCVCVLMCVREGETVTQPRLVCKHIRASSLCLSRDSVHLSGLELMVKLRTLLTVFTIILKAEARDYGKGRYISDAACGVRPSTMHCASWPIRADCACRKEGLCRKRNVWERQGIEDLQ